MSSSYMRKFGELGVIKIGNICAGYLHDRSTIIRDCLPPIRIYKK